MEKAKKKMPRSKRKKQEPKADDKIIRLEKRILKVEELNIVLDKWRKLNEAKKNLTGFQLGDDGLSAQITLQDSTRQEFKTSHSMVVNTALDTLQNEVNERICECEQNQSASMINQKEGPSEAVPFFVRYLTVPDH